MTPPWTRRAFLGGGAGALALPLLPSLSPREARAAGNTPPKRLVVFFVPNGVRQSLWRPAAGSRLYLSPMMSPLAGFESDLLAVSGLDNRPAHDPIRVEAHYDDARALLCATNGVDPSLGRTLDQDIADVLGPTRFHSLHLGSEAARPCPPGPCAAYSNISWQSAGVPSGKIVSTRAVYGLLYGNDTSGSSDARVALGRSVLDAAREDLARFSQRAGSTDAARLDAYATHLRELERRLVVPLERTCPSSEPSDVPLTQAYGDAHIEAMIDLIVLALQCDQTRVVTYMLSNERSYRPLDHLGYALTHHDLSHHLTGLALAHLDVVRWEVSHLARLLGKLASATEPDGSRLLDHTYVLFCAAMGEGDHVPVNLPILLAGGGSGALGQHVEAPPGTPLADFWISLRNAFGIQDTTYGDDGTKSLIDLG